MMNRIKINIAIALIFCGCKLYAEDIFSPKFEPKTKDSSGNLYITDKDNIISTRWLKLNKELSFLTISKNGGLLRFSTNDYNGRSIFVTLYKVKGEYMLLIKTTIRDKKEDKVNIELLGNVIVVPKEVEKWLLEIKDKEFVSNLVALDRESREMYNQIGAYGTLTMEYKRVDGLGSINMNLKRVLIGDSKGVDKKVYTDCVKLNKLFSSILATCNLRDHIRLPERTSTQSSQ